MKFYHEASKIVKPKLEALSIAEANLDAANKALMAAEVRLEACQTRLNELQAMFDAQMAEKRRIEDGAMALQRKSQMASQLIGGGCPPTEPFRTYPVLFLSYPYPYLTLLCPCRILPLLNHVS